MSCSHRVYTCGGNNFYWMRHVLRAEQFGMKVSGSLGMVAEWCKWCELFGEHYKYSVKRRWIQFREKWKQLRLQPFSWSALSRDTNNSNPKQNHLQHQKHTLKHMRNAHHTHTLLHTIIFRLFHFVGNKISFLRAVLFYDGIHVHFNGIVYSIPLHAWKSSAKLPGLCKWIVEIDMLHYHY